jgi:hypothetical protein
VKVTADEADSMAVVCGECGSGPGMFCTEVGGSRTRPHRRRITEAAAAGLLGGKGRAKLARPPAVVADAG